MNGKLLALEAKKRLQVESKREHLKQRRDCKLRAKERDTTHEKATGDSQ